MSVKREPKPVLLFTGILFSEGVSIPEVIPVLYKAFGETVYESVMMNFIWSDYYESEMGPKLRRLFLVYKTPFNREKLPEAKRKADELEALFLKNGKRTVNIDPGLICLENVELATNKGFSHRVYLRDGVYVEVTLFYKNDTYQPIEYWTYPEYRSTHMLEFFNTARSLLLTQ